THASAGLRVLAVARRPAPDRIDGRDAAERGLCLLALVSLFDPPRAEVAEAVKECHQAGIRVMMVTGDHALTARAIAERIGLRPDLVVNGPELDRMSDRELED